MTTFKITNITNLLGKRGFMHNSEVEAEYIDGMIKKTLKIKPQETVYLTLNSLPLSIHRLRIKGLVTVSEISKKELKSILSAEKVKEIKLAEATKEKEVVVEEVNNTTEDIVIEEEPIEEKVESKSPKKYTKKSTKDDVENKEEKTEEVE